MRPHTFLIADRSGPQMARQAHSLTHGATLLSPVLDVVRHRLAKITMNLLGKDIVIMAALTAAYSYEVHVVLFITVVCFSCSVVCCIPDPEMF